MKSPDLIVSVSHSSELVAHDVYLKLSLKRASAQPIAAYCAAVAPYDYWGFGRPDSSSAASRNSTCRIAIVCNRPNGILQHFGICSDDRQHVECDYYGTVFRCHIALRAHYIMSLNVNCAILTTKRTISVSIIITSGGPRENAA